MDHLRLRRSDISLDIYPIVKELRSGRHSANALKTLALAFICWAEQNPNWGLGRSDMTDDLVAVSFLKLGFVFDLAKPDHIPVRTAKDQV